jgi:hypothetical protein
MARKIWVVLSGKMGLILGLLSPFESRLGPISDLVSFYEDLSAVLSSNVELILGPVSPFES